MWPDGDESIDDEIDPRDEYPFSHDEPRVLWEDPEPWRGASYNGVLQRGPVLSINHWHHEPRSREQYLAETEPKGTGR